MDFNEVEYLQRNYSQKTEEELIGLVAHSTSLTPSAKNALKAELKKRDFSRFKVRTPEEIEAMAKNTPSADSLEPLAYWFWVWPSIIDIGTAKAAMRRAAYVALFTAVLTSVLAILSLTVFPMTGIDAFSFVDATVFAIVAWRIFRCSRLWAVAGLVLYCGGIIYRMWIGEFFFGALSLVITMMFLSSFITGVRGTFAYHSYVNAAIREEELVRGVLASL